MLRQTHFVPPVPLVLADKLGLIPADLNLEQSAPRGSDEQLSQLLADEQDLAVTAFDNLFAWNARGTPVHAIAQIERVTPLTLFARPDIRSLRELEGRRFAVDALDNGFALAARRLLEQAEVDTDFVEIGGVRERLSALVHDQADAALLGPPFDTLADQKDLVRLATVNELFPGYPGQVLVARADTIRDKREELRLYVAALHHAVHAANSMTSARGVSLLESTGLPKAAAEALWHARARSIRVDTAGAKVVADVRESLGMLAVGTDVATFIDDSLTEAAEQ